MVIIINILATLGVIIIARRRVHIKSHRKRTPSGRTITVKGHYKYIKVPRYPSLKRAYKRSKRRR